MLQRLVRQRVLAAVGRVEMPPLGRHPREPGGEHGVGEPAGLGAARAGERPRAVRGLGELVELGGQLDGAPGGVGERDVDRGAAAVPGSDLGVRDVARIGTSAQNRSWIEEGR